MISCILPEKSGIMVCSRRRFIRNTLTVAGALALSPFARSRAGRFRPGGFRSFEPAYLKLEREGKLAQREKELWSIYEKCRVCPRKCEVNRLAGQNDVCKATDKLKVHSAGSHFGEEAPLVGKYGSGTIFFSDCSLRCCFCQNWEIAHRGDGGAISHSVLARAMLSLQERGCHNINLVTPTHMVPHIVRALRIAVAKGLRLPLVYNTGGYDRLETIQKLDGVVDIYMPDFKFQDGEMTHRYCREAADYPEVAAAAIKEMHRQVGVLRRDERGIAERGAGTDRFVRWVAEDLSPDTCVNIMDQYRPCHEAFDYPEIARPLNRAEWRQAVRWARDSGLTNLDL
jgi:putative pyruvate formate lyase activating enzyme